MVKIDIILSELTKNEKKSKLKLDLTKVKTSKKSELNIDMKDEKTLKMKEETK
jgi:hypothetical protein